MPHGTRTATAGLAAAALLTLGPSPSEADWFDGFGGANGLDGEAVSITEWNGGIVVGGRFTLAGGVPVNNIAFWDGMSFSALGSGLEVGPEGLDVWDLAVYQGNLIAAGDFRIAGGLPIRGIASWNGTTWDSLGTGMRNEMSSLDYVRSLHVDGDVLYAGGDFETMGGVTVGNVAKWDGEAWSPIEGALGRAVSFGVSGHVNRVYTFGGDVIVGGNITQAGGTVAVSNAALWSAVEGWQDLDGGLNGEVFAIGLWETPIGSRLVFGGDFVTVDEPFEVANRVATLDPFLNEWLTPFSPYSLSPGLNGRVCHVEAWKEDLVLSGEFTELADVGQTTMRYATAVDAEAETYHPFGGGLDGAVRSVTVSDDGEGEPHFVGTFRTTFAFRMSGESDRGGISSERIARWMGPAVPVTLSSFTADRLGRDVVVRWVVDTASDHAGFHVHRDFGSGAKVRLTDALLSGRGAYTFTDPNPPLGGLRYWLEEIDGSGRSTWHGPAVAADASTGNSFVNLAPVRPNPVRESAAISFAFDEPTEARVSVHDASGRVVITLHDGVLFGIREITWDGRFRDGRRVPAGVYFVTLFAKGLETTEKFVWAR